MSAPRNPAQKRQYAILREAFAKVLVEMMNDPQVRMTRHFIYVEGEHGTNTYTGGFDSESLNEVVQRVKAIQSKGIPAPDQVVEQQEPPKRPKNVIGFPSDRGWD